MKSSFFVFIVIEKSSFGGQLLELVKPESSYLGFNTHDEAKEWIIANCDGHNSYTILEVFK